MKQFRTFRSISSSSGVSLMHRTVAGQIKTIHVNCGFVVPGAFDAFWARLNEHLRDEWPEYEDTRRLTLFRRALSGEKISRANLIGPHLEVKFEIGDSKP
jgi:hypothetical protein